MFLHLDVYLTFFCDGKHVIILIIDQIFTVIAWYTANVFSDFFY